ncbi:MAG: dephospho-CoA kinase [Comamonadaceae bacterium]|jgi:dephospho-CoA kinase|nr:dephospho-CoA kinase [Comamonadaceae bacterium]
MRAHPQPPWRIGLTGGIGSGKSTVAAMLQALGAPVLDADALARACTAPGGAAIEPIRAAFGPQCIGPDGALEREQMRALVFAQPTARQRLEAIVHPLVRDAIEQACAQLQGRSDCVVLDIPLLAESAHWVQQVDAVWVVDCSTQTQIERVRARNGWPLAQIHAVLDAQASRAQRLALADTVLDNDAATTLPQLQAQVAAAYARQRQQFGL